MEANSMFSTLRRRWWVVVLLTMIGVAAGAVPEPVTAVDPTSISYQASHTLLISNTSATETIFSDPVAINQLQLFATTGEVPKRVAEKIGYGGNPAELSAQITVAVDQSSGALRITSTGNDSAQVVTIADAFGEELTGYLAERQDDLQTRRVAATLDRLTTLETDVKALEEQASARPDDRVIAGQLDALSRQYSVTFEQYNNLTVDQGQLQLTTLERAQPITLQSGGGLSAPNSRSSRGILLGGVGFLLGLGVVVLLARIDRRIRSRAQAEAVFGLRSQVSIPPAPKGSEGKLVVLADRHDGLADAYRTLRSVVGFIEAGASRRDGRAPMVLVVSAGPGDGKTSVSANLAAAFVETGQRTIAVNTDFRRPSLSMRILGEKPEPLCFEFEDLADCPASLLLVPGFGDDMSILDLASVKAPPGDLARETARLLPELMQMASVVVVDSSPVGATAEVLELVPMADVIVLVTRLHHTTVETASRTVDIVRALNRGHLVLVVVGDAPERSGYYNEYEMKPEPRQARRFGRRRQQV